MTRFFLPGVDVHQQEQELARMRACAGRQTASVPVQRRIHRLLCRVGGHDCHLEVGCQSPVDGADIVAIFDLGRGQPYGVFTTQSRYLPSLIVRHVYSVTEFA